MRVATQSACFQSRVKRPRLLRHLLTGTRIARRKTILKADASSAQRQGPWAVSSIHEYGTLGLRRLFLFFLGVLRICCAGTWLRSQVNG